MPFSARRLFPYSFTAFVLCFHLLRLSGQWSPASGDYNRVGLLVDSCLRTCDFRKALYLTDSCLGQTRPDSRSQAIWLMKKGEIRFVLGDVGGGNDWLEKAEKILHRVSAPDGLLSFRYNYLKGLRSFYLGKNNEALQWFRRAESYTRYLDYSPRHEIARLYGRMGSTFLLARDYAAASDNFRRALKIYPDKSLADRHGRMCLQALLAEVSMWQGDMDRYRELIHPCLEYIAKQSDPFHPALLEIYLSVNNIVYKVDDISAAVRNDFLQYSTTILNTYYPADHYYAAMLYSQKGMTEYARSNYANAMHYSNLALQISEDYLFLDFYKDQNYSIVAPAMLMLEPDRDKVIAYCGKVATELQKIGFSPCYMFYIQSLAYRVKKDTAMIINSLNKMILFSGEHGPYPNREFCCMGYHEKGKLYLSKRDYGTSRQYFQQALLYAKNTARERIRLTEIHRELGVLYRLTGDYHKALFHLQQSVIAGCRSFKDTVVYANPAQEDIMLTRNLIKSFSEKAFTLYAIYEHENNSLHYLTAALNSQELAVKLNEERVIDLDEERSGLLMANYKTYAMNNAVSYAVLLYLRTGDQQYAEKAWEYAEKSKMQVLSITAMKKETLINSGLPDSLIRKYDLLNNKIMEMENLIELNESNGRSAIEKHNELVKLAGLYGEREELHATIQKDYPDYKNKKYQFKVAPISQVQQWLEKDQVILEYQLLATEIITFVITKNDYQILFQPIDKKVPENIARLRKVLATSPFQAARSASFQEFTEASRFLYTLLIEPVREKIKDKRLIIIPPNLLTQIPFEVLISRSSGKLQENNFKSLPYLIREFPIAYGYSANLLLSGHKNRKFGSGTAIFLPDYSTHRSALVPDSLQNLQGATHEVAVLKRLTGGKLYTGNLANESGFKSSAQSFRILHIASHTLLDENHPGLSCLIMTTNPDSAGDGNLYAYEVAQMNLEAQLVVLSGCNTGYGLMKRNEGLISIARSFFYTGVRTVAYTLWPLADQAGSDLVILFYKGLCRHQALDIALRNAKLRFLEETDPVKAHPYYWAGLVIVGRTDPVPVSGSLVWSLPVAGVLLILILLFMVYKRKSVFQLF